MIGDGGEIVVGDERGSPDFEKLINNALREMGLEVQNFSKLESFP